MAFRKILTSEAPKRPRKSSSRFERTAEWAEMKKDLEKGLKKNEALEIVLTEDDKKKYHLEHRRTVTRFIRKYLQSHNMPFVLKSFSRDSHDYFIVMCPSKQSQ